MLPKLIDQTAQAVQSTYGLYTLALRGAFAAALAHIQPHSAQARSGLSQTANDAFLKLYPDMAESIATAVDTLALQAIADAGVEGKSVDDLDVRAALETVKIDLFGLITFVAKSDARRAGVKLRGMGLDRRLSDAVRSGRDVLEFKTPDSVGRLVDSSRYVVQDVRRALVRLYVETLLIAARSKGATHFDLHKDDQVIGRYAISGVGPDSYLGIREGVFHPNTRAYPVIVKGEA